jgi:hypothetical protein
MSSVGLLGGEGGHLHFSNHARMSRRDKSSSSNVYYLPTYSEYEYVYALHITQGSVNTRIGLNPVNAKMKVLHSDRRFLRYVEER